MSFALQLHGAFDARVAPFNLREGRPDEALLRVAAVGICGSDLHYFKDGGIGSTVIKAPFVPGHEFGGWLEADLEERRLAAGNAGCRRPQPCLRHLRSLPRRPPQSLPQRQVHRRAAA